MPRNSNWIIPFFINSVRKEDTNMSLLHDRYRKVPEYYPHMYRDGFTPEEILYALKRKMLKEYRERQNKNSSEQNIKLVSEINVK